MTSVIVDDALLESIFQDEYRAPEPNGIDPLRAKLKGQDLVKHDHLVEGTTCLSYALNEFLRGVTGKDSDVPQLYMLINDCYLFMMSATLGIDDRLNMDLIMERQEFLDRYHFEERTKGEKPIDGYIIFKRNP